MKLGSIAMAFLTVVVPECAKSQLEPIGYYCTPYFESFAPDGHYTPDTGNCHYLSPTLSGNRYGDVFRGVPGASTLAGGHFLGTSPDSVQSGDSVTYSPPGTDFFAVIYETHSGSDITSFRNHFRDGSASPPHQQYGVLRWKSGPVLRWPLVGAGDRPVNLPFGADWVASCGGQVKLHTGSDFQAVATEWVFAAHAGTVTSVVDATSDGWAFAVTLESTELGAVFTTVYWHIDPLVSLGEAVSRGDPVGRVANLGGNTHFHLGFRVGPYENFSNRGALPQAVCEGDPAFPEHFRDPATLLFDVFGDGFETGNTVRWQ